MHENRHRPSDEPLREDRAPHREFRRIRRAVAYEAPDRGIPEPFVAREPADRIRRVLGSADVEPESDVDPDGVDSSETSVLGDIAAPSQLDIDVSEQFNVDIGGEF